MKPYWITIPLVLAVAVLLAVNTSWAGTKVCDYEGCNWLATGVVTNITDSGFTVLGKDGRTYAVRSNGSEIVSEAPGGASTLAVGDVVRVFGAIAERDTIHAVRVRIFHNGVAAGAGAKVARKPEIRIVVEKPQAALLAQTPVAAEQQVVPPDWDNRGLITEIDSTNGYIKIRTSSAQYTVYLNQAKLLSGARVIRPGQLSIGDAVRVVGYGNCNYTVIAQQVDVTQPRWEADSAIPQLPVSRAGMIQTVDYPSQTFTMTMNGSVIQVMTDKDTCVQSEKRRGLFSELKPGMRVKMTGYGSLATGYAAQHIQIISVSP